MTCSVNIKRYVLPSGMFLKVLTNTKVGRQSYYLYLKPRLYNPLRVGTTYETHEISKEEFDALYPLSREEGEE